MPSARSLQYRLRSCVEPCRPMSNGATASGPQALARVRWSWKAYITWASICRLVSRGTASACSSWLSTTSGFAQAAPTTSCTVRVQSAKGVAPSGRMRSGSVLMKKPAMALEARLFAAAHRRGHREVGLVHTHGAAEPTKPPAAKSRP